MYKLKKVLKIGDTLQINYLEWNPHFHKYFNQPT
jgi:hypothetical protein